MKHRTLRTGTANINGPNIDFTSDGQISSIPAQTNADDGTHGNLATCAGTVQGRP